MDLDAHRSEMNRKRLLTPSLYGSTGLDLDTHPGSIEPPPWLCEHHTASWRSWTDYQPYVPIILMSIGKPVPLEHKRRRAIAEQREVIARICDENCEG